MSHKSAHTSRIPKAFTLHEFFLPRLMFDGDLNA